MAYTAILLLESVFLEVRLIPGSLTLVMNDMEDPIGSSSAPSAHDEKDVVHDTESANGSNEQHGDSYYPEGGLQAWLVVSGSAATMFCTFGYLTGFGYVNRSWASSEIDS